MWKKKVDENDWLPLESSRRHNWKQAESELNMTRFLFPEMSASLLSIRL